jgi:hypothetical protein
MALLSFLMLMLISMTDSAGRVWRDGRNRTESFQSARTALEILAREMTPAVVDTRMQFIVAPGTILTKAKAPNVVEESPTILWMAPLGDEGDLRCVGYYLFRDEERRFFRLKRIFISPKQGNGTASPYFPRMVNLLNPRDATLRTSPTHANWFTSKWNLEAFDEETADNDRCVVSTAADGVIALWVQSLDVLGNPIPWLSEARVHPRSELQYNSAAYFQMATSEPFDGGISTQYLAETANSLKANRVPAAIEITIVTLDGDVLRRAARLPEQANVLTEANTLDVEASRRRLEADLAVERIQSSRTFTTRVRLVNGN